MRISLAHSPADNIARRDLENRILADDRPVTLICAPAGAGKSHFLRAMAGRMGHQVVTGGTPNSDASWIFWDDVEHGAALPVLATDQRLIIASRPQNVPVALARGRLYGSLLEVDGNDLLVPKDLCSAEQWRRSHGWPLLLSPAAQDDALLRAYIATDVFDGTAAQDLWAVLARSEIPDWCRHAVPPLASTDDPVGVRLTRIVRHAAEGELSKHLSSLGHHTSWLDDEVVRDPMALRGVMARMIQNGEVVGALAVFDHAGGWTLFYRFGQRAFADLIALFPEESDEIDVVLSRALLALKEGEVQYALTVLVHRFGHGITDTLSVVRGASEFPLRVRIFRILLLMYQDLALTDALLEALFAFATQIRLNNTVQRGTYYNAMLEFLLRLRRYDEAEDAAGRALKAYEQANVPLLAFYISVHRAVMRLMRGEASAARHDVEAARARLSEIAFESPGDWRLLKLVETILQFEDGEPQALLDFLEHDLDEFSHGEIWPSLVELAVVYGSQVLCEQASTRAALAFLDQWQLYMALNRQFRHLIEVRKAQILQNKGRWGEAALILSPIQAGLDRVWVESAETGFTRLDARDDILLAMSWLRQIAYERPRFVYLDRKLQAMRQNPRLTERQLLSIDIWSAYVARHNRDHGRARALLLRVFELAARRHSLSVLSEEQIFLSELWADQRMATFLDASGTARAVQRRLEESRHAKTSATARATLTRQELKVLVMLTEGASNKGIARRLGLSEPTVKFHLRNLYRKLAVSRRAEAVATARGLGWVG